ncbi:MAG: rhomboid family intramembrane serine protease [Rhodocyclaceae bacterium]|nr:rhomboid family intramembrane serine protease [Rhodocyclaceae bacterium]
MSAARPVSAEEFADALYARMPTAWLTWTLVAANLAIFVALAWHAEALWRVSGAILADWGGNYAVQTRNGASWRLVSALFLHGGLLHVALNMLALNQAGQLAERLFGRAAFAVLYVLCGIVASVASVWWQPNGLSVGASGAVFGVFGALLSYVLVCRSSLPAGLFGQLRKGLLGLIAYSLLAGFALPGIDNAAHLGGLASGLLLGAALARPLDAPSAPARGLLATVVVLSAAVTLWSTVPPVASPPLGVDAFQRVAAQVAREEAALARRYHLLLDGLRAGRIEDDRALLALEHELVPAWQALEARVSAEAGEDWRAAALLRYLAKRRDALQAVSMAIRTRDPQWADLSSALQRKADQYLLEVQSQEGDIGAAARQSAGDEPVSKAVR